MCDIKTENKYLLSTQEASVYFNIGINKLRQMINTDKTAKWIVWNGSHAYIKRKLFEEYIDSINVI